MKNIKKEEGAITIITLVTILFIVSFLISSYIIVANKVRIQKEIVSEIGKIYEPKSTMEEIYNSYTKDIDLSEEIKVGDVITEIDGKTITTKEELTEIKNTHKIGDKIKLKIYRNKEYQEIELTLEEEP